MGRPVLVRADLKYLPFYGTNTSFTLHLLTLAGFDDETGTVLVADTGYPGLQAVPVDAFIAALVSDRPPKSSTDSLISKCRSCKCAASGSN